MMSDFKKVIPSHASSDGDGVKIRRVALFNEVLSDPFLMIDELKSDDPNDYIGGFPPHPHRGMETLTYLKHGGLEHKDSLGNKGMIHSGGAQWMSAGRGVIHSEMPSRELDKLHGFQLWINLPAADKMKDPDYRDVPKEEIPSLLLASGAEARVIAGDWTIDGQSQPGPLDRMAAQAAIADLQLPAGTSARIDVEAGFQMMAMLYEGQIEGLNRSSSLIILNAASGQVQLTAQTDAQLLLLKGAPLKEPVAHYGPFVMSTADEIDQAIRDYNAGTFVG